jgi:cell division septum initiation protein DivIVA
MSEKQIKVIGILTQLEQELDASPRPKLGGGNKRIIDMDAVLDILGDIKATIPEDIRRAYSVLAEADCTLENAQDQADDMVAKADAEAKAIIDEANEYSDGLKERVDAEFEARVAAEPVMIEANKRADALIKLAEENASIIFNGSKQYADDILADMQRYIRGYIGTIQANREELGVRYEREIPHADVMQPEMPPVKPSAQAAEPAPQPIIPKRAARSVPEPQKYAEYRQEDTLVYENVIKPDPKEDEESIKPKKRKRFASFIFQDHDDPEEEQAEPSRDDFDDEPVKQEPKHKRFGRDKKQKSSALFDDDYDKDSDLDIDLDID